MSDASAFALRLVRGAVGGIRERMVDRLAELRAQVVDREVDLQVVLQHVVDEAARALDADRGTLWLADNARGELASIAGYHPELPELRMPMREGVAGFVARTGTVLNVPRRDPRFAPRIDASTGYRTETLLAAPVIADGRTLGVLQVLNHRGGPFDAAHEDALVAIGLELAALLGESSLRSQLAPGARQPLAFAFNHIVGSSPAMEQVYARTRRAAATDATVLIRGESGTGKELVARAVHHNSARREAPFVVVDCAALPESLIENELFGHERGAFTGADRARDGKVHAAAGGTLFLDEIGELSPVVQGKLLRLVQDRRFFRVGGVAAEHADVRFVCATWRDLEAMVERGTFRRDLYYRLRVVEIRVPALCERGEDLDRLLDHFVYEFSRRHRRGPLRLDPAARAALLAFDWPGNVRELQHAVESAVVLAPGDRLTLDLFPFLENQSRPTVAAQIDDDELPTLTPVTLPGGTLAEVEAAYIRHTVERCGGNRSMAARILGIGRNTLARKLAEGG